MKHLAQRIIFTFRIADDDVIICQQESVGDLTLRGEGFTAARGAQYQAVGILQLLPIHHDQVVAQCVQSVIQAFAAGLKQFLGGERNENGGTGSGQRPLNLNFVESKRQGGNHGILLLEIQGDQLTVVFLRDTLCLQEDVFQLPLAVSGVHQQESHQEHAFVPALQVFQQLFGFIAVGGQIAGDDVNVISAADGLFLLVNLALIQIGDLPLDRFDGFRLINGLNMHGGHQTGIHGEEIRQHPVIQLRSHNLEKRSRGVFFTYAEGPAVREIKAGRSNEILRAQSCRRQPGPLKKEFILSVHMENAVHQLQARLAVHGFRHNAQPLEIVQQINLDALQAGLGGLDVVGVNAEGDELGFRQTVIAFGQLILKHIDVFQPNIIETVVPQGNHDGLLKGLSVGGQVQEGKLKTDTGVKIVEKIAPSLENGGLVLALGQLVIDILKLDGLGEMGIRDLTHAVQIHPLIGNGFLRCVRAFVLSGLRDYRVQLFPFCPAELTLGFGVSGVYHVGVSSPLYLFLSADPRQRRSCWSDTPAFSDAQTGSE